MSLIWLVDDSESELELWRLGLSMLARSGVSVRCMSSVQEVDACWGMESPDIVLTDYTLTTFVVTEVLDRWRARSPSTVFLVWSGREDDATRDDCLEHGAHQFLMKPNGFGALRELLEREVLVHLPAARVSL